MIDHKNYISQLQKLLAMEKQQDYEQFKAFVESLPLIKRKEQGYSWHPLDVRKSGYTYGERAFVIAHRTTQLDAPHSFRPGKVVSLFTLQPGVHRPERSGVIQFVDREKMKIILNSKDLPDWLNMGQIGVDLMFDERSYLEMERALEKVLLANNGRLAELRDKLISPASAEFNTINIPLIIPALNTAQNKAVSDILAANDICIVHGPPGTGKTTTLVHAVNVLSERESTILVTAPSNTAVDLLTERLANQGLNVVRVGNISRVDDRIIQYTLESLLAKHPESKNIKKVRIEAAAARRQARQFKRRFGLQERQERRMLRQEARELSNWAIQLEDRLVDQILGAAQVITSTLVSSTHKVLEKMNFKTVVIDEAAQALEPATWIPITKASKVILAGDPFQLPPTVKSTEARKGGLEETLLEKCIGKMSRINFLDMQYRMNETIMGFSNQFFYEGLLRADESVAQHGFDTEEGSLIFIDTAGCGFDEAINEVSKSRYNEGEFLILREHLYQLIERFGDFAIPEIAIISPYREQVLYIQEKVKEDGALAGQPITVNTIDGFQGQESEIVYISLVRSNEKCEIGFLADYRRMNVAMTRARKMLVVIGDSATIGDDKFYRQFLEYCEQLGIYRSAWEYMQGQ